MINRKVLASAPLARAPKPREARLAALAAIANSRRVIP
jgi:hypothetical protein